MAKGEPVSVSVALRAVSVALVRIQHLSLKMNPWLSWNLGCTSCPLRIGSPWLSVTVSAFHSKWSIAFHYCFWPWRKQKRWEKVSGVIDTSASPKGKRLFHIWDPGERVTLNVHISPRQVSDSIVLWRGPRGLSALWESASFCLPFYKEENVLRTNLSRENFLEQLNMYSDFPPQSLRFSFYGELIILQNVGGRTRVHSDFSSGGKQQDEIRGGFCTPASLLHLLVCLKFGRWPQHRWGSVQSRHTMVAVSWHSLPSALYCAQSLQSCLTLCDPMDCSPPGSSVHEILQARTLEWIAMLPPEALPNQGIEPASLMSLALASGFFTSSTTWEAPGPGTISSGRKETGQWNNTALRENGNDHILVL